jgi:ribonuclease VapC
MCAARTRLGRTGRSRSKTSRFIALGAKHALTRAGRPRCAGALTRRGLAVGEILDPVRKHISVEDFGKSDALSAAALQPSTAHAGLSPGDRACLALAQRLNVTALTADHAWTEVRLDVLVQLIRPHG